MHMYTTCYYCNVPVTFFWEKGRVRWGQPVCKPRKGETRPVLSNVPNDYHLEYIGYCLSWTSLSENNRISTMRQLTSRNPSRAVQVGANYFSLPQAISFITKKKKKQFSLTTYSSICLSSRATEKNTTGKLLLYFLVSTVIRWIQLNISYKIKLLQQKDTQL